MTLRDKTAVVGIGATPYYKRGESLPRTELELAGQAILGALDDAGLTVGDLDGFAIYSSSCDPAQVASVLEATLGHFAAVPAAMPAARGCGTFTKRRSGFEMAIM